jgi:hypothetical protein
LRAGKLTNHSSEILVAVVAGFLGVCVAVSLILWARLPDHTVDLLVFSESAFGIGITVIALIFALVTVNQIKEIDRRFAEITKDIEGTANEQYGNLQRSIAEMVSTEKTNFSTQQLQAVELLGRAERANDSSQTNYTTAMTSIWELDRRVKALEAKTK